jgi:hypothetical protein
MEIFQQYRSIINFLLIIKMWKKIRWIKNKINYKKNNRIPKKSKKINKIMQKILYKTWEKKDLRVYNNMAFLMKQNKISKNSYKTIRNCS